MFMSVAKATDPLQVEYLSTKNTVWSEADWRWPYFVPKRTTDQSPHSTYCSARTARRHSHREPSTVSAAT